MKTALYAVLLVFGALVLALAGQRVWQSQQPDPAVARVLHARENAWKICRIGSQGKYNVPRLAETLCRIGPDGCPSEFRQAWFAYIEAWRKFAERHDHASNVAVLKGAAALLLHRPKLALAAIAHSRNGDTGTEAAWQNVRKSAVIFRCRPAGQMPDF